MPAVPLHALGVIDFSAFAFRDIPNSDGFVVTAAAEFSACRGIIYI
jgi:hypothetical protein